MAEPTATEIRMSALQAASTVIAGLVNGKEDHNVVIMATVSMSAKFEMYLQGNVTITEGGKPLTFPQRMTR